MTNVLGRYRLDDRLGQGGMGVVYRAWDTVLERVVALKLMTGDGDADPAARERFFREARAAAQLTHKNIVTVYDLGEHEGQPYLAMEFLDGEDLQRRLARSEKASVWRKVNIAIEICQGVEFAHAHGVIHRDLKPGNIFITATGGVKILDFGLARFISSQLTQSNMLLGTINYMSPEQVRGERADQQSDVFSIGVVLYELFGGRRAFEGDSAASTLYKILQELPEPLWKIDSGLPRELAAIIDCALAKPRDERYPDVASLRRDLEMLQNTSQLGGPATPRPGALVQSRDTPAAAGVPPSARAARPDSAPNVTPVPAARIAGNTRGFWVGAGLGALAIAFVVVWMANRPVEPAAPAAKVPVQTRPAPEVAPTVPSAPEATPASEPAPAAPADRRAVTKSAGVSAAPPPPRSPQRAPTSKEQPAVTSPTQPAVSSPTQPAVSSPTQPTVSSSPQPTVTSPPQPTGVTPAPQPSAASAASVPQPAQSTPPVVSQPSAAPIVATPTLSVERANELLQRYKAALESRSLDQLKRIWPSLGGASEAAIRQEFQHASRIAVDISDPQVAASGTTGRITFIRGYSLVTEDGQRLQSTSHAAMDVRRAGDIWVIDSIRFSPR